MCLKAWWKSMYGIIWSWLVAAVEYQTFAILNIIYSRDEYKIDDKSPVTQNIKITCNKKLQSWIWTLAM